MNKTKTDRDQELKRYLLEFRMLNDIPIKAFDIRRLGKNFHVSIRYHRIEELRFPAELELNIEVLELINCNLKELPGEITKMLNLKELYLRYNKLTSLPAFIGDLRYLQVLDLLENQILALPESIGKLTELLDLDLTNNGLQSLPTSLTKLTNLRVLELFGHRLWQDFHAKQILQQLRDKGCMINGARGLLR